jgi:uncharacterized protein DUF3761
VIRWMVLSTAIFIVQAATAQTPPAGSTGQCKDGTYTSSANKSGACHGHQGVKEWFADSSSTAPAAKSTPASAATPAPAAAPAAQAPSAAPAPSSTPAKAAAHTSTANIPQAAGGGPGLVWVNTATNVYHCYGSQYYGKTKQGSYMSEADAKAKGAHADHNHPCSK